MRYMSSVTTPQERKKIFRQWAKKLHPDVGGDPEEFKRLLREYETTEQSGSTADTSSTQMCAKIHTYMTALEVPVSADIACYKKHVEVALERGIDLGRVLKIEQGVRGLTAAQGFSLMFRYRGSRQKPYSIETRGEVTYINFNAADYAEVHHQLQWASNTEEILWRTCEALGKHRYEFVWDNVANHGYIMHCSRTMRLADLVTRKESPYV